MSSQKWICTICGYECEASEAPEVCPICGAGPEAFEIIDETPSETSGEPSSSKSEISYLSEWERNEDSFERKYARIADLSKTGKSQISAMRTQKPYPDWDEILFKGAQLHRMPLNEDEEVRSRTVIGKSAKQPLAIDAPIYVSHMSFGALSREAKIALAKGSKAVGTAIASGEGGMLPEERQNADRYIYELGTASFSHVEESILAADAIEIKIGQAAKPGMGGHLPKDKITEEIAQIRKIPLGVDSISPSRPFNISNREDLKKEVARLRDMTGGKPIGIKLAAGRIEDDLEFALSANPDFITIDCRGGATGAAPTYIKDNVCLPPIYAVHRARKFLNDRKSETTLCVTGGFRDSADIAKALAMGVDAVALATSSLIAIGCQQYRICQTGKCPVGITTQDPELRKRFDVEQSVQRFINFYTATLEELKTFARINGRKNIHDLDISDIFTLNREISDYTNIEHA